MKTITILSLIAEETRVDLEGLAKRDGTSINNLIIDALNKYLLNTNRTTPMPAPKAARQFSIRLPEYLNSGLLQIGAEYQIKLSKSISRNQIINTAITEFLKEKNGAGASDNH